MLYENKMKQLTVQLNEMKVLNMRLQAEIVQLRDEIRVLSNEKVYLESYNHRLLHTIRKF